MSETKEKPKSEKYLAYLRKKALLDETKEIAHLQIKEMKQITKGMSANASDSSEYKHFELEIKKILDIVDINNATRVKGKEYDKSIYNPDQRIIMTLLAEKNGLCSWTKGSTFVIGRPAEEIITVESIPDFHLERFNSIFNSQVQKESNGGIAKDLKFFNLENEFKMYADDVYSYGSAGQKRRDTILKDHIIEEIKKSKRYQDYLVDDLHDILDKKEYLDFIDPPFTIAEKVYNPSSNGKSFISIDLKSACFLGYQSYGIFDSFEKKDSWESFLSQFTKNKLFMVNKSMRLAIFGKLGTKTIYDPYLKSHISDPPTDRDSDIQKKRKKIKLCKVKNQILYQNIALDIWLKIQTALPEFKNNLIAIEGDEIILSCDSITSITPILKNVQALQSLSLPSFCNISAFTIQVLTIKEIQAVEPTINHPGYLLKYTHSNQKKKYEIKGIDSKLTRNLKILYYHVSD